jgi:phage gp36-like protein
VEVLVDGQVSIDIYLSVRFVSLSDAVVSMMIVFVCFLSGLPRLNLQRESQQQVCQDL